MVERTTGSLLRRHVSWRPHHHPHLCLAGRGQRSVTEIGRANVFCQSEIQHLDTAFVCDHDIGGLQVTVHDAFFVSSRQSLGQRFRDFDDLLDCEAVLADQPVQWQPFDKLHRQKVDAFGFLHRVDRDNIGMVELRQDLRFSTKTC